MNLWKLPAITIAPEVIIPGTWITNTLLCTWISIICLLVVFFIGTRRRDLVPAGLQNALEWLVEFLQNLVESVAGKERGKRFLPLVATFFIFILFCNLLDVIPGVDTIGIVHLDEAHANAVVNGPLLWGDLSNQIIPWLRPGTTDLNLTLSMALVSVVVTQILGFSMLGFKDQASKYLNFKAIKDKGGMGLVDFLVGVLEIISELGRLISFSFRLFGNIFAGSVLLAVFAYLLPVVANVIFVPFELFVAVIQAFVFAFLTLLFMQVGTTSHSHHDEGEHEVHHEYEGSAVASH
ncbi:ATP synthase subunit a [Dictyobacter vulcani]|uniref:ATP synthase subunit a n=1 Tax=Dictyobacter vulcani TaxID=2607529 RepID=A0A5J4KPQ6_9CHLR|nr:F0F1 ATP synthase subunit A [Dictyobacter vulcani]GER87186.1 ATP synthase subunit a [Dictyobacter vulcani]